MISLTSLSSPGICLQDCRKSRAGLRAGTLFGGRTAIVSEPIGGPLSPVVALVVALVASRVVSGAPGWSSVSQAEITPPALLAASPSRPRVAHSRRFPSPGDAKTSTGGSGLRNRLTALGTVPLQLLTFLRLRRCLCPGLVVILRGPDDRRAAKVVALPLEFLNGVGRALIEGLETRGDNLSTVDLGHLDLVKQLEGLIPLVWHTLRVPSPRYGAHCGSPTEKSTPLNKELKAAKPSV